jgi:hypothetical protein
MNDSPTNISPNTNIILTTGDWPTNTYIQGPNPKRQTTIHSILVNIENTNTPYTNTPNTPSQFNTNTPNTNTPNTPSQFNTDTTNTNTPNTPSQFYTNTTNPSSTTNQPGNRYTEASRGTIPPAILQILISFHHSVHHTLNLLPNQD